MRIIDHPCNVYIVYRNKLDHNFTSHTGDGLEEDEVDVAVWRLGQEGRLPHVLQHQARVDEAHESDLLNLRKTKHPHVTMQVMNNNMCIYI